MRTLTRAQTLVVVSLVAMLALVLVWLAGSQSPRIISPADAPPPPTVASPAPSMVPLQPPTAPTRESAVEAATFFVVAFDGPSLVDEARRTELLDQHAAPEARSELGAIFDELDSVFAESLALSSAVFDNPGTVWRTIPAGWRVDQFSSTSALVSVWGTGIIVEDGLPLVPPNWQTTIVTMRWDSNAWRLQRFDSESGPQPPPVGSPDGRAQARAINEFTPYHHLAAPPAAWAS